MKRCVIELRIREAGDAPGPGHDVTCVVELPGSTIRRGFDGVSNGVDWGLREIQRWVRDAERK